MFNYKKFSLPMIFTTFFSYSTNKTESPCANSRYSQCLNCFSYLLQAVKSFVLQKKKKNKIGKEKKTSKFLKLAELAKEMIRETTQYSIFLLEQSMGNSRCHFFFNFQSMLHQNIVFTIKFDHNA